MKDLYLAGNENLRESQCGGTVPSLWSQLAQTLMVVSLVADNHRQPHKISLVGMHLDCRVRDWITKLNYKTEKRNALNVHYSKQTISVFLLRSLIRDNIRVFNVVRLYRPLVTHRSAFSRSCGGHHALHTPLEYAVRS